MHKVTLPPLLSEYTRTVHKSPEQSQILALKPLDPKCTSLQINLTLHKPQQTLLYSEIFSSEDFFKVPCFGSIEASEDKHNKKCKNEHSLLFLKLALQQAFSENHQTGEIVVGQDIIWEKVVHGEHIKPTIQYIRKQKQKQYTCIGIKIVFPQPMLLILPEILDDCQSLQIDVGPSQQKKEIEQIFFQKL